MWGAGQGTNDRKDKAGAMTITKKRKGYQLEEWALGNNGQHRSTCHTYE